MTLPKITFGMIVLNAEPFLRYNLRALYPFAHEIIVAEGASPLAAHVATSHGHSIDRTLSTLRRFKEEEDPHDKVTMVTAEDEGHPNGFWLGEKDEQSQAYAKRATGDWLWQIDCDEFYRRSDLASICDYLAHSDPSMVFFYFRMFMYHPSLEVLGVQPEYSQCQPIPRIFRWGPGYKYTKHRPPTVVDPAGRDLKSLNPTYAHVTLAKGWYIFHYPFLYTHQFGSKSSYYSKLGFRPGIDNWALDAESMARPKLAILWQGMSWLTKCREPIPEAVRAMTYEHLDYQIPQYVHGFSYRALALLASAYLRVLTYLRTAVCRRTWFRRSYAPCSGGLAPRPINQATGTAWLKSMLKRTPLHKFASFTGLIGYKTF